MIPTASPAAPLAGVHAGIQSHGLYLGRRQLFVRFAAEAETAVMYTPEALANEIGRAIGRSSFHSIAIGGRDPLGNVEYLVAALDKRPPLPVLLDCDGHRPEAVEGIAKIVSVVQVTLDGVSAISEATQQLALNTVSRAAEKHLGHALVLIADERATDALLLRLVERAHGASEETQIVLHPGQGVGLDRDKRWPVLLERAMAVHGDVRLLARLPAPTGMR